MQCRYVAMLLCAVSSPPPSNAKSPSDLPFADVGSAIPEVTALPELTGSPPPGKTSFPGPRERALEAGFAVIGDADLLAIVLGTGCAGRHVTQVSAALLEQFGGLEGLARVGASSLAQHPGLGLAKALRISGALELGRRAFQQAMRPREPLRTSASVAAYFMPRLCHLDHEELWVIALDGRNAVRGTRRVAQGGLHGCSVAPRDILRAALADAASAILLVHNHPSADPTPSMEDLAMTRAVAEAAAVVGMPLLDHVIIGASGRYASLLDLGAMPQR
ncbi:MAG TPA: DNA repair protein RadC [Polyangiaceae bacterium]|nr:DNA repair protein RadC [Polyangiaceae bacterium]